MFEIKENDVSIISRIEKLQMKMQTARDGKDPSCNVCDENGNFQISRKAFYGNVVSNFLKDDNSMITLKCDCYSLEKTKLREELEIAIALQERFRAVFNLSEHVSKEIEELTLSSYGKMFGMENISNVIKKWINHGMPCSLFLTGKPGTGKTTTLKILWQIMALNKLSVYYFNCQEFEKLCLNLYNKNAEGNVERDIKAMVAPAKRADILLVDDHACMNMNSALMYYLEIFNARSESNKQVVITSNKNFSEVLDAYNFKDTDDTRATRDRLYSRLVERLKISELVFEKSAARKVEARAEVVA